MTTFVLALTAIVITVVAMEEQASEHCIEDDAVMKVAKDELTGQGLLMRETLRSKEKASLEGAEKHASAVSEDKENHASAAAVVTGNKIRPSPAVTEVSRKEASLQVSAVTKDKAKHVSAAVASTENKDKHASAAAELSKKQESSNDEEKHASAVTDSEDDMEAEDVDIDDELTTDGKQLWKSTCPKFCSNSRKLKNRDWSEKCWMWACQLCQDYKENCETILEGDAPDLCGERCSESAERMLRKGKSKSMCLWPNCQTCEGWKTKCEQ